MTKDPEDPLKYKGQSKKRHGSSSNSSSKNMEGFLKNQNEIVAKLKADLQDAIAEKQQIKCEIIERNKCIQELQNNLEDRNNQIQKLKADLLSAKDENEKIFQDLYLIKGKYYELEAHYDKACQQQNREIDNMKRQLEQQLQELSSSCEELKQQLHERNQAFVHINLDYSKLQKTYEKCQQEFEHVQNDFENYRKQVVIEKNVYDEKIKQEYGSLKQEMAYKELNFAEELTKLKEELSEKDEMIRQCIKDKEIVEEEKSRKIEELNYKINQIEKVFGQPTKMVAPLSVNPKPSHTVNVNEYNSPQASTSAAAAASNVAITKPQIRRESLETNTTDNNSEFRQVEEVSSKVRSKKIPRPQNATSSSSSAVINSNAPKNNVPNRKRGSHGFKNPSPPKKMDAFSTTSSDDDDDKIVFPLWRPNNNKNGHYVPETETDASESFAKTKRSRSRPTFMSDVLVFP